MRTFPSASRRADLVPAELIVYGVATWRKGGRRCMWYESSWAINCRAHCAGGTVTNGVPREREWERESGGQGNG